MNTYHVYLRKGGRVLVTAYGYTEAKREGRVYFHNDREQKKKTTFFSLHDLAGIHTFEKEKVLTHESLNQMIESLPGKQPATGELPISH